MIQTKPMVVVASLNSNGNRRRTFEKARIQKLKNWHEDVKKIARSEIDFIKSIFKDENDKDSENRDWIRDDEEDVKVTERDGKMVTTDS